MKLRREDLVVVRSGNYRGQGPAKIVSIDRDSHRAIVEGINNALKHVKRGHPKSPQGGRVTIPVPIDISNLALHCPSCNRGVRVKVQLVDGAKRRVCGRCQKSL
jgi:large subunit ribosomal protein L24